MKLSQEMIDLNQYHCDNGWSTFDRHTFILLIEEVQKLENQNKEMLEALIKWQKWHYKLFEINEGCPFNCDDHAEGDCYYCIHTEFCDLKHIIEKATGKQWEDIINDNSF